MNKDYKVYSVDTKTNMYQHITRSANTYGWQTWSVHSVDGIYAVTFTRKVGSVKLHGLQFYVVEEEAAHDQESTDVLDE